jgi:hypothetical protein
MYKSIVKGVATVLVVLVAIAVTVITMARGFFNGLALAEQCPGEEPFACSGFGQALTVYLLLAAPLVLLILAAVIGSRKSQGRMFALLGGVLGAIAIIYAVAVIVMGDLG